MKPRPKMAKLVLTTWAACFARQKPVSTSAKPACMKMTRTAPRTTHSMLGGRRGDGSTGSSAWAKATPPAEQRHERRAGGASEDVLQRSFPSHRLSLFRGPQTWMRPPGRSVRQLRGRAFPQRDPHVFRLRCVLARAAHRRGPEAASAGRRAGQRGPDTVRRRSSNLRPSRSLIAKRSTRRRRCWRRGRCGRDPRGGERGGDRGERARAVASCHRASRVPRSGVVVELDGEVGGGLDPDGAARGRHPSARRARCGPRADGRPDEERVDHRTVRPGGQRRPGDVATGVVEGRGEVGQEGVAVAAGDVDDPVVGRPFGAHRHSDRAGAGRGSTSRA